MIDVDTTILIIALVMGIAILAVGFSSGGHL